jgi:hypothetical protein
MRLKANIMTGINYTYEAGDDIETNKDEGKQ